MNDNSHVLRDRDRRADAYTAAAHLDGGIEAARMLRVTALLGIATRLFYVYASVNRISVTHALLGVLDANGRVDPTGQPHALDLVAQANDADGLVNIAIVASIIGIVLFVLALISLGRRKKRGDEVAGAVDKNRAVRLAARFYVLVAVAAVVARNVLNPSPEASPADRLHRLLDADAATIGLQIAVVVILLIVTVATGREVGKARAAGRIG
jgi:heme/copper-type cytochrome/quinol oxidase subunit 2